VQRSTWINERKTAEAGTLAVYITEIKRGEERHLSPVATPVRHTSKARELRRAMARRCEHSTKPRKRYGKKSATSARFGEPRASFAMRSDRRVCFRPRQVVAHRGFRDLRNDAKNGFWLCDLMAVRRQSGITAVRALKRIVEFLHVSSDVLFRRRHCLNTPV
jgi:hypothetical protein